MSDVARSNGLALSSTMTPEEEAARVRLATAGELFEKPGEAGQRCAVCQAIPGRADELSEQLRTIRVLALRALTARNCSINEAARLLGLHPNTAYGLLAHAREIEQRRARQ